MTTFLRIAGEGGFPDPVWITSGRKVWLIDDLDRWLDGKAGRVAECGDARDWLEDVEKDEGFGDPTEH